MKGIVLAAGDGGRLRPLSDTQPKVLLPLLGKPLIAYPVDSLAWAGITEIGSVRRPAEPEGIHSQYEGAHHAALAVMRRRTMGGVSGLSWVT